MTRVCTLALLAIASIGLSACSGGQTMGDSDEGIILITHTTKGTLYWE